MLQQADTYSRTFAIQVFESATNDYNCHGYAWHKKEGGNNVWINNLGSEANNLNNYWNDGSYFVYSYNSLYHTDNLKVFYGNSDHTAITTSDPNVFISKMGCGCLVSHNKDNSPYTGGNFTYYLRNNVFITSSSPVCASGGTVFTINNLPSGATVVWSQSSNLQQTSSSGNTCTVKAIGSGNGWVKATISGVVSGTVQYNVWCGTPNTSGITVNLLYQSPSASANTLCRTDGRSFGVSSSPNPLEGITEYQWNFGSWASYVTGYVAENGISKTIASIQLSSSASSMQVVTVNPQNVCSTSSMGSDLPGDTFYATNCYGGFSYSAYPNPASTVLTVDVASQTGTMGLSSNSNNLSRTLSAIVYDVHLYDGQGVLVYRSSTQGNVEIDVSSLSNGYYYLHIYDGSGNQPEMQTIVVAH